MIRVLSRTLRAVVVLVSLGAGIAPLGCKLATKDNPAVCESDQAADHCAEGWHCENHHCKQNGTGGAAGNAAAGSGGSLGSGGAGGRAMAVGGAGGGPGVGGT